MIDRAGQVWQWDEIEPLDGMFLFLASFPDVAGTRHVLLSMVDGRQMDYIETSSYGPLEWRPEVKRIS